MSVQTTDRNERLLHDRRIALVGKLASMPRRDAEQLIRRHGGQIVAHADGQTEIVVVGDESGDVDELVADPQVFDEHSRLALQEGRLQIVREAEFWARLGLVDAAQGVKRLYTPVILAELLRVPVRAIRHWHRKGHLIAGHMVGRLPYFDFEEVRVARRLGELLSAGSSLSRIDRKFDELSRLLPSMTRPLAEASLMVVGTCLYVRRGDGFTEPNGQLLLDFEARQGECAEPPTAGQPETIPLHAAASSSTAEPWDPADLVTSLKADELRSLADEFEEDGRPDRAIEVYRALLMSGKFTAEDQFSLAELLYRCGDFAAARERYYAAIELDDDYVEARANLGCVLMEQGEHSLAEAAFRGALEYHPDFADAHYHLARLLDSTDRPRESSRHWARFLELAPASPWAEEALDRTNEQLSP